MLNLLKIENIALIDRVELEFGDGLNVLTGETGSGKSMIVDSLAALTGARVSSDLIRSGAARASIEAIFSKPASKEFDAIFTEAGIDAEGDEIIVRRELSSSGKNRVFINDRSVTAGLLRSIAPMLVDIHGQGEHDLLYEVSSHLEMLDQYAGAARYRERTADAFAKLAEAEQRLNELESDEAAKLQLLDILHFQVDELKLAAMSPGEDDELQKEKNRLNNAEKLTALSTEVSEFLYDNDDSAVTALDKAALRIDELAAFDERFAPFQEALASARASIEEAARTAGDFRDRIEFSPERLAEIDDRLAEITRLTRKYGGTIASALEHLAESEKRLANIVSAETREAELRKEIAELRTQYVGAAEKLSALRWQKAKGFQNEVERDLNAVALQKARFEVRIESPANEDEMTKRSTAKGFDRVEFYFSANAGEPVKPLSKVASGGEASRLMLILKTAAKNLSKTTATVFDEIDAGIGGRVAEAVGVKLNELGKTRQVLCVTHQPQVASKADTHLVVEKSMSAESTSITVRTLSDAERIEEVARMLAGEKITNAARENAREMLAGAGK
jgi:DNA repair protein RecN (Recombination protein N)